MTARVAVLCFEESRPWVSALRQGGFSVPWVEEPKAEFQRKIGDAPPDLLLVDLTRMPELGEGMVAHWAAQGGLAGVPVVLVCPQGDETNSLTGKVDDLSMTTPQDIVSAVKAALVRK
ncbi:MAG: hypothetical protein ACT4OM_01020 [Actinomycetota bacterium]